MLADPPVLPTIKFAAMTAPNPYRFVPSVTRFALRIGRSSGQAVKPPQFDGKTMAVKIFIECGAARPSMVGQRKPAWFTSRTIFRTPASVLVWSLDQKGVGYSFDDV